jgi:hypothetical protein
LEFEPTSSLEVWSAATGQEFLPPKMLLEDS